MAREDDDLSALPWTRCGERLDGRRGRAVALLPVGSTEPHGPHLPLETDVIISSEMARRAAASLRERGVEAMILPPVAYSVTDYSRDFPGAIGLTRETSLALIREVCLSALEHGFDAVGLVNSHLEPDHLDALRRAAESAATESGRPVVFPDKTRRRWAMRLTEEFRSGACHAGRYETSLVLAVRPDLVDREAMLSLPPVDISIGRAIKEGKRTFREAGGTLAYFGDPASATPEEGHNTFDQLASMVVEEVMEALGSHGGGKP